MDMRMWTGLIWLSKSSGGLLCIW